MWDKARYTNTKACRDAAIRYLHAGFCPIPVMLNKRPCVHWRDLLQHPPSTDTIAQWWQKWPDANVAIALTDMLCVIDFDGINFSQIPFYFHLPLDAPRVTTGKGLHVYLKTHTPIGNRAGVFRARGCTVDVRGKGGYVVAPPSVHVNGNKYEWLRPFGNLIDIPDIPDGVLSLITSHNNNGSQLSPGWYVRKVECKEPDLRSPSWIFSQEITSQPCKDSPAVLCSEM
jgi:hypothetical protein